MSGQKGNTEKLVRWLVPLFLIGFAAIAIYYSTTFKKMPPILKRGIQPSDFPQLISGLIISLTLLMVWFDPIKLNERVTSKTWLSMAALIGFVLALVGAGIPIMIFFLFDLVFRVRFPRGILTSLWYG